VFTVTFNGLHKPSGKKKLQGLLLVVFVQPTYFQR